MPPTRKTCSQWHSWRQTAAGGLLPPNGYAVSGGDQVADEIGREPLDPHAQAILGTGEVDVPLEDLEGGEPIGGVGDLAGGPEVDTQRKPKRKPGPVGASVRSLTAPLPLSVLIRCGSWWAAEKPEAPDPKDLGEAEKLTLYLDHATAEHSLWCSEGVSCPHCGVAFVPESEFVIGSQYDEHELHMQGLRDLWGQEIERQAAARAKDAQAHMLAVLTQCKESGQTIDQAIAALAAAGMS
jgi:hypothetical protein